MPIYEYRCGECGRGFEELIVRKASEAEVKCPSCGCRTVERQMSRTADARPRDGSGKSRPARSCGPVG